LFGLVTELASGSALTQRAGRVNRIGRAASADIVVVAPADASTIADYLPYRADDLRAALDWVERRAQSADGMAPWAIEGDPAPVESPRRLLYQRPELYDAWWWSHTSEDLYAPSDLSLYLRDDLEPETAAVGLVLREFQVVDRADGEAPDPSVLLSLLRVTPPVPFETFDVTLGTLRQIVARALDEMPQQVFVFRDGAVIVMTDPPSLRPGDVVVLSSAFPCLRAGVPVAEDATGRVGITFWGEPGVGIADPEWRTALGGLTAEQAQAAYDEHARDVPAQVILPPDAESAEVLPWVVLKPPQVVVGDTEQLQVFTEQRAVTLDQHRANVEHRVREIAGSVELTVDLVAAVTLAGRLHDEGKRDARFQRQLGAGSTTADLLLAKSERRSAQQARRDAAAAGLRSGWRHEQLSAAIVLGQHADVPNVDLIARLVGTSHGRGRATFDHPPSELRADRIGPEVAAAAEELFGAAGRWEQLIEATEARWGVWGCAYLEAIVRAADCQVSREGS
jgi:CRISPR-associated endonuclease/helicase Cas3